MNYIPYLSSGKYDIIAEDITERDYLHIGLESEITAKKVCEYLQRAYEKGCNDTAEDM